MVIIKEGQCVDDRWHHLDDQDALPESGPITVSAGRWRSERESLMSRGEPVGIRIEPGDAVEDLAADLRQLPLVVLNFPALTDGRLFSAARLIRERYGYAGELRARGDFLQDQIFFLSRVGVNAFEPPPGTAAEDLTAALSTFSVTYQAATDESRPLYRRAHRGSH
jgi:uncharacterized protein (DUF934 family)